MKRGVLAVLLGALVAGLTLASCGGGGTQDATIVRAGQLDIKLPPGWKVVNGKAVRPADASATTRAAGSSASSGSATATTSASETTIPLNTGENPQTAMFTALSKFSACLKRDGVKFAGAPNSADPNSPTNDPAYIKSLSTCAAQSNIVAALKASQTAQDNLTPAQIKQQNEGYLVWRKCMVGRGWKVPEPKPDAQGRLFTFSTSGSQQGSSPIVAPAGKDILTSSDVQDCAKKAQASAK